MRWSLGLAALLALVFLPSIYGDGSARSKRPLDLPAGNQGRESDEEDAPETILFYGSEVEGDVFCWCIPAYGFCGETDVFNAIKAETTNAINQLTSRSKIGLVGYNSTTYIWSPRAKKATAANKASAVGWMSMLVPIEAHCLLEAAETTMGISQTAPGNAKQIIIMGARTPYCGSSFGPEYAEECLVAITASNYENSPVNTIYFTSVFYSGEQEFYQDLAAMNQGTFRQVDY